LFYYSGIRPEILNKTKKHVSYGSRLFDLVSTSSRFVKFFATTKFCRMERFQYVILSKLCGFSIIISAREGIWLRVKSWIDYETGQDYGVTARGHVARTQLI
jgi:hypothetical protein